LFVKTFAESLSAFYYVQSIISASLVPDPDRGILPSIKITVDSSRYVLHRNTISSIQLESTSLPATTSEKLNHVP